MRMDPSAELTAREIVNEAPEWRAGRHLPPLRRGALRPPDRPRDRTAARQAAVRADRRARRDDQAGDSRAGPVRRGPSRQARLPGAPDRGQRRARRARAGAARRARDAAAARPPRGDLVPLARGSNRQALPAGRRARLHLPARLPGLRLRRDPDPACDPAPGDQALRGRGRTQPALAVGTAAGGGEGWLAGPRRSTAPARAGRGPARKAAEPATRPRRAAPKTAPAQAAKAAAKPRSKAKARSQLARRDRLDRARWDSARRRRIRKPGRAAPEPPTRQRHPGALAASGRERRALLPALGGARLARASRRSPISSDGLVQADPSSIGYINLEEVGPWPLRCARSRRTGASGFSSSSSRSPSRAMFARAFWLQTVEAAHLSHLAKSQQRGDADDSGRPRHDLRPHRRPARDRRAGDDDLRRPAARPQRARDRARRAHDPRRRRELAVPRAPEQEAPVRLRQALRRPGEGRALPQEGLRRDRLVSRGAPHLSAGRRRARRCSASPASTTPASAGSSSSTTASSPGGPASQTIVRDPTGQAIDVISSRPGAGGLEPLHDDRPHDPGAGREGAARDGRPLGRPGRERARARPGDRRGARHGADARLRREQHLERRPLRAGAPPQPDRHRHLRAGLHLQARDAHGGASPTSS